jgi:hypothetical protein
MQREKFGPRSERSQRLIDPLEAAGRRGRAADWLGRAKHAGIHKSDQSVLRRNSCNKTSNKV